MLTPILWMTCGDGGGERAPGESSPDTTGRDRPLAPASRREGREGTGRAAPP